MVKGLKVEDELEIANSNKRENESEIADSVEQLDSEKPNHLKAKLTQGQQKRPQQCDSNVARNGRTSSQADRKGRGTRNRTGQGARARGEACRSKSEEPEKKKEPQVELEGEC